MLLFLMSLHLSALAISTASLLMISLFKWKKPLMIVIMLEGITITLVAFLFLFESGIFYLTMLLFVFFVGETLIILTAVFFTLQTVGVVYGTFML